MIGDSDLDSPLVARLIGAQFPTVPGTTVRWLGEGYDSAAFEVDGEWVFRFPKRSDVEQQLLVEMRVLPILAAQSPLPVPAFCFRGVPSPEFPHHFGGYRKLPGLPAIQTDPSAVPFDQTAPILARFLSWLHAFPRDEATRLGIPRQQISSLVEGARAEALTDFAKVHRVAPQGPLECWHRFLAEAQGVYVEPDARTTVVHGDFAAEHILYDMASQSITGVIDWSEIAVGDPAFDLAGLMHWGGTRFLDSVLSTYNGFADAATICRARYFAACRGVGDIVFGLETDRREYIDAGIRALTLSISPSGRAV